MRKHTLKEKFILSFFLVIIPLILFLSFFTVYDYNLSKRDYRQTKTIEFKEATDILSYRISEVDEYLSSLKKSVFFSTASSYSNNDYMISSLVYKLRSFMPDKKDIHIAVYPQGSDMIYLEDDLISYSNFEKSLPEIDFTMSKMFSNLNSTTYPQRFRLKNSSKTADREYIALIYPISSWEAKVKYNVLIMTPEERFIDVIEDALGSLQGNLYIYDTEGKRLISSITDVTLPSEESLMMLKGSGLLEKTVEGMDLILFRRVVQGTDLTMIYAVEKEVFYSSIERHMALVISVILISISLITGLAIFLVQYNYRPIRRIIDDFVPEMDDNANELDIIRNIMESRGKDQADISMKKDRFLLSIVQGQITAPEEMREKSKELGLCLNHTYFFAIVAAFEEEDEKHRFSDVCMKFTNNDDAEVFMHFLVSGIDGTPLFLIGYDALPQDVDSTREDLVRKVIAKATQEEKFKLCWGIGNVYTSASCLRSSTLEARAAARLANHHDENNLFFYNDLITKDNMPMASLPILEQNFLLESLRMGELEMADVALDNIVSQISKSSNSLVIAQMLCYDVLNILFQFMHNSNIKVRDLDFMKTEPFQTVEGFRNTAHHLIREICTAIEKKNTEDLISQDKTVDEYIEASYRSTMLSNDSAAEALGISKAKLNDICRNLYGCTFSQKIVQMRMSEVKRLLSETDEKISCIITSVGYSDVPNFVRKFRQTTGMTPSQYRELNK